MTKIQEYLAALPEDKKALFIPVFGSVDKFYTVVYLIIRNEHVTDQEKPERYEDRLQVIRQVKIKWKNWFLLMVWTEKRLWRISPVIILKILSIIKNRNWI